MSCCRATTVRFGSDASGRRSSEPWRAARNCWTARRLTTRNERFSARCSRSAARVVVPDYQLSLAIGREGQNARLAARLTGWRIDIRSDTEKPEA